MTSREGQPGGFGGRLREARERRGMSLRQIAEATKISVAVLDALERNDVSRLPGGIFGRAFVRSYAIEVGLDPDAVIQDFVAQFPHDSVAVGHPADQTEDNIALESDRRMAGTFLSLLAISVPVAGMVLYFASAGRPPSRVAAPDTQSPAPLRVAPSLPTAATSAAIPAVTAEPV